MPATGTTVISSTTLAAQEQAVGLSARPGPGWLINRARRALTGLTGYGNPPRPSRAVGDLNIKG